MVSEIVLAGMRRGQQTLEELGLRPVLIGGLAIQPYGRRRQTMDTDFLVVVGEERFEEVFRAAEANGLKRDVRRPIVKIGADTILRLVYEDPKFGIEVRIDVIQAHNEFLRNVVARARSTEAYGEPRLHLAQCEDLILLKLLAGRPIDRVDAAELLRENLARLDEAYLNRWAETLRLVDELEEAKRESREDEA